MATLALASAWTPDDGLTEINIMPTETEVTLDIIHPDVIASDSSCAVAHTALAPTLLTSSSAPIGYDASTRTIKFKVTPADYGEHSYYI